MATQESSILCNDRYIWENSGGEYYGRQFFHQLLGFGHIEDHDGLTGSETKIVFTDQDRQTVYRTGIEYADIDDLIDVVQVIHNAVELIRQPLEVAPEYELPIAA